MSLGRRQVCPRTTPVAVLAVELIDVRLVEGSHLQETNEIILGYLINVKATPIAMH